MQVNNKLNELWQVESLIPFLLTISGGSATHLLTLSPKTEGLFQRAIIMSGCAYNPWALTVDLNHTAYLYKLAEEMGHPVKDYDGLLKFMQDVDPKALISESTVSFDSVIKNGRFEFLFAFSPLVEREDSITSVFTHTPESYVTNEFRQDIDLMFGYATGVSSKSIHWAHAIV